MNILGRALLVSLLAPAPVHAEGAREKMIQVNPGASTEQAVPVRAPRGRSRRGWFQRTAMAVKADGSVVSCREWTSEGLDRDCMGYPPFDPYTASEYVKFSGYEPARVFQEVRFYPEGEVAQRPAQYQKVGGSIVNLVVKADGTLRSCEVVHPVASPEKREAICREVAQWRFEPIAGAPDAKGLLFGTNYLPKPGH